MYKSISQLLNDPRHKRKLDGIADITHDFLVDPNKEVYLAEQGQKADPILLDQYSFFDMCAPVKLSDDFQVLQWLLRRNMSIGSLIPTGGNIPSSRMGELIKLEGGFAKLALGHTFDEETTIRMIEIGNSNNIPQDFVEMLYGSVNDLQRKLMKLANVLTAQMFYQGFISFVDPRTNVGIQVTYDVEPRLFPAPIDPALSWDQYQTAQGIQDLIDHAYEYYLINGFYPKETRMSRELMNHLLRQESTATYAEAAGLINKNSANTLPKRVTRDVLKQLIIKTEDLPPIVEWDAQYELEISPNQTERVRYIPSHTYCFAHPNIARRIFSPTIESLQGTKSTKPKPGIFLKTDEVVQTSPVQSRSFAVARFIPQCDDTRRLAGRQVITTA